MTLWTLLDVCLGAVGVLILKSFLQRRRLPLPPGPKGLPLVGNILDIPPPGEKEWLHWAKHKDIYGPISSVTVLGQTIVLLNDCKIAFELLEKPTYSDRPTLVFAGEMCGWEYALALLRYGDRFRNYRKRFSQVMGTKSLFSKFHPMIEVEARRFLTRLLDRPDAFSDHIRKTVGASILKIAYGYRIEPEAEDPLIQLGDDAVRIFCDATVPGAWLVDNMPFLKNVPDWLPGTGFKKTATAWKQKILEACDRPFEFVKNRMAAGDAIPSYTSALLEDDLDEEQESIAKWSAATFYVAGSDTTVSTISSFFLAMTLYPEAQRKAQEEIDRVIGQDRLPTFTDRPNLPYVDALCKECFRWNPAAPMSVPHRVMEDDIYKGYLIPKDALVIANMWVDMHDPNVYPDPMVFKPERFLETKNHRPEYDVYDIAFGFGRRICPGQVLADGTVWMAIAVSLAVFNISKKKDGQGKDIDPVCDYIPGLITHPKEYECSITPRSAQAVSLIRAAEEEYPQEDSDACRF